MKLRSIDIFCASQASTAILHTTTMDLHNQPSSSYSSSSSAVHPGGRAIDRHNPIIRETTSRRIINTNNIPCTSTSPLSPIPYKQLHHKQPAARNNSFSKPSDLIKSSSKKSINGGDQKRKSKSDVGRKSDVVEGELVRKSTDVVRKSFGKQRGDFVINGTDSARYLLGEAGSLDLVSDFEPGFELDGVSNVNGKGKDEKGVMKNPEEYFSFSSDSKTPPPPPLASSRSPDQVVVLRVSLHCKGCEGKVRKHISRMQGVTSFNIDFAAKKVTVVGDVTPLEVLSSISKVKTAQLWTPQAPSSLPAASSSFSEIKKSKALAAGM